MLQSASSARPEPVAEEEELLSTVQETIERFSGRGPVVDYDHKLLHLRDALSEERLVEDQASIVEQMVRISHLKEQQSRSLEAKVDAGSPYFGHMRLEYEDGRVRDVMIGRQTFVRRGATIVDWRHAPIARVFYQCREGDDFELEVAGRELSGDVLARRTVSIVDGELLRVGTSDESFVKTDTGWIDVACDDPTLRGGAGTATRPDRTRPLLGIRGGVPSFGAIRQERIDKHLPEIASLLDPEQYELITRPDSGVIVVQGSAGSGKTTVALHRVAYLSFLDERRFKPNRTLVLVFSRALASYIDQVLPALGVEGVQVETYDAWIRTQRRRHLPDLPNEYNEDTPALVTRLKLHSALIPILLEAAALHPDLEPIELFDELFTNRRWLGEAFASYAPTAFSSSELDQVHEWCTRQHFNRDEDGGVMDHEVPSLDVEDDTILIRLFQLLKGPLCYQKTRPLRYHHLVIDEVQDLSPLEIRVLLDTVKPGTPVTLAGDTAQMLMADSDFQDWDHALGMLDLEEVHRAVLRVSYRSTAEIMSVAQEIVAPLQESETTIVMPRGGAPVELLSFRSQGQAMTYLSDALKDLVDHEPAANVALLARYAEQADEAYALLEKTDLPRLRRVRDQDFSFAPGIEVTDIRQSKGLEFDYVVLLDCDDQSYPNTPEARHTFHVGMTRAAHQCWLVSVGRPSAIIPSRVQRITL
ncbi:MAG: AAA family ATPase [Myxococcales bacterium]|nr:AAA family ATPase [Myxococcales bacterium]